MKCEQDNGELTPIETVVHWPNPIGAAGGQLITKTECVVCHSNYNLKFPIEAGLTIKQILDLIEKIVK